MPRFKIIYQREQEDCGATCLVMILRFYGIQTDVEAIKAFCGNMKNGVTLYELNRTAKRIGFNTQAVRLSINDLKNLKRELLPFIVYWKQSHFIVVYRITSRFIYIADPAIGKIKYNYT